ncbi:hypothetical protein NDU88_005045 [Pleurodeles waltl]|uniref:Uncharacterized protein n=1 Tax=Pleurodeles waltl TaxID=8319 RepID=A0AAV7QHV1_PLEWA|nr:hypothetical protein NDU88_005045 [Pleurodeles waltl]
MVSGSVFLHGDNPAHPRPDRSELYFLLIHAAVRRPVDHMQGCGFATKRRPQMSSGPREARSGRPHLSPKGSPDAAAPHELPDVLQGGLTEPKCLPTRYGACRRVERLS